MRGSLGPTKSREDTGIRTSHDPFQRGVVVFRLYELWVSDSTDYPTRTDRDSCCNLMDTCNRRNVASSIETTQECQLVINALERAISEGMVRTEGSLRADHGVQFTQRELLPRKSGVLAACHLFHRSVTLSTTKRWNHFGHQCKISSVTASAGPRASNSQTICWTTLKSSSTAASGS